ncbi:MAG: hypothetical protein N2255_01045 [Kiritimatiellae bacterium]|nr:hypothetical protein [Kiritimatiellia bacterium]
MRKFKTAQDVLAAVVGYGGTFNMGRHHLHEMQRVGFRPVAVVDLDPERLASARNDFPGIETYDRVEEMLKKSPANLVTIVNGYSNPTDTDLPGALAVNSVNRIAFASAY